MANNPVVLRFVGDLVSMSWTDELVELRYFLGKSRYVVS